MEIKARSLLWSACSPLASSVANLANLPHESYLPRLTLHFKDGTSAFLFFLFSSLPASLYTPNCAEIFDGGWEESERRVEEKRNWALTLIRWRASAGKKEKKKSASQQHCQSECWCIGLGGGWRLERWAGWKSEAAWWMHLGGITPQGLFGAHSAKIIQRVRGARLLMPGARM